MEKKILLVDDEEGIRKVLGISLADIGYTVLTAENGRQALRIFRDEAPPIVLTDIKMPVMDGIELLTTIKRENPDTEVIMLTGHGDMNLAIKCLKLDARDFITKPINDDVLEIALKRACEKIVMRQQLKNYTENLEQMVQKQSEMLVKAERLAAVGQTVEGLSSAFRGIAGELDKGINYFNELPCFVSIHNRRHRIIAANPLYVEKLGDNVGKDSSTLYKTDKGSTSPVVETFKTGKGLRKKAIITYRNGVAGPVIVHTAPIRNQKNEVELVVEISADIGEVRKLQEKLHESEKRFQHLFDEAPCYITVQNPSFEITAANRRFQEDFKMEGGSFCFQVYKGRNTTCDACPVKKTFKDQKSHQCEMEVTSKRGETFKVLIQTAPIFDASGSLTHVMEMSTNITQVRALEEQLASLGLMIGSVSHGIKGLLTGLDGGMYLLNSGFQKKDEKKVKEGWETVRFMAGRIRHMVLDILYYAKQKKLNWECLDVIPFSEDILKTVAPKVSGRSLKITQRFDESIGRFKVDAGIIRSAITNIIENAIEACTVDKSKKEHEIVFQVKQDDDFIFFVISDNGIGMDEETKANVFTPFYSLGENKGTGLGLYISNRILSRHGGKIAMVSAPEQGTVFTLQIPKNTST